MSQAQIPKSQTQNTQSPKPQHLADILHEDYWKNLHPSTRIIVKILQHIKSKIDNFAEVRVSFLDDDIIVTTYKSEIRISKNEISFKRWTEDNSTIRVQRVKIELSDELIDIIKKQILDILEHGAEPNYRFIVEVFEKTLRS